MKMTSEHAKEYHDWLREKVHEWQEEHERAMSAEVATGHIHTTRARADSYAYALDKFIEMTSEIEPAVDERETTEPLHEMAKRLCSGRKCTDCPVDVIGRDCAISGIVLVGADIYAQLAALRRWAAENPPKPQKTYREDFFERFPDAPRNNIGYPRPFVWEVYDIPEDCWPEADKTIAWDKPLGYWAEG